MESAKKVLIVEDDESLRKALQHKLTQAKITVVVAVDGSQGLAVAKSERPDLILLDIIMPVMDGLTMLVHLKSDESLAKIPVIFLTNLNDQDKLAEVMSQGVYDYLIKSDLDLDDILDKVKRKLDQA